MASEVVLGPVQLEEGVLSLHSPRPEDAAAWSQARRANRDWLERAFPARGDDWMAEQSELAFVERYRRLRRARRDNVQPFVLRLDGRLVGELGVDAVDPGSGQGEGSVWMVRTHGSSAVMNAATLLMIDHVFAGDRPIPSLLSPVPVAAREGRRPGLTAVGFTIEGSEERVVGDRVVEHDLWVLPNTEEVRERTATFLRQYPRAARVEVLDRSSRRLLRLRARAVVRDARSRWRRKG